MATPDDDEELTMITIKMPNGDFERSENGESFHVTPDYTLYIQGSDKAADPVAAFHPSGWWAVFNNTPKAPPLDTACDDPEYSCCGTGLNHVHVHKDWANRRTA